MFASDPPPPSRAPWAERGEDDDRDRPSWMVSSAIPDSSTGPPLSFSDAAGVFSTMQPPQEPCEQDVSTPPPSAQSSAPPAMVPIDATLSPIESEPPEPAPPPEPQRDWEGELQALEQKLVVAVGALGEVRRELLEASERDLVQLAVVIAEKVVGRELATDPALVARWARRGLEILREQDQLKVVVSNDIAAAVPPEAWMGADGQPFEPVVDPKLPPGSCEVRGEFSRIDASAAARLRSVAEALGAQD